MILGQLPPLWIDRTEQTTPPSPQGNDPARAARSRIPPPPKVLLRRSRGERSSVRRNAQSRAVRANATDASSVIAWMSILAGVSGVTMSAAVCPVVMAAGRQQGSRTGRIKRRARHRSQRYRVRRCEQIIRGLHVRDNHVMNPRSGRAKRPMLGSTIDMLAGLMPNHLARVAAYSSVETPGIHAPRLPVSFGPPIASVGMSP